MKAINLILLISVVMMSFATTSYSQKKRDRCASLKEGIKTAERYYIDGDLERAVEILELRMEEISGCSDEQRDALLLLSKLYLLINEDQQAEESYIKTLKIDPSFKLNKELEPTDMLYFAKNYRAIPRWSYTPEINYLSTIMYAPNQVHSIEAAYVPTSQANDDPFVFEDSVSFSNITTRYSGHSTFGVSARGGFYLNRFFELSAGIGLDNKIFSIEKNTSNSRTILDQVNPSSLTPIATNEDLVIKESQIWVALPVMLRFNLGRDRFIYSFHIGAERNQLLRSRFTEARRGGVDLLTGQTSTGKIEEVDPINVTSLRERSHWSLLGGMGVKFRPINSKRNYISFDVKYAEYRYYLTRETAAYPSRKDGESLLSEENRLRQRLLYQLGYSDDNYGLDYVQFSLGYTFTFYRVKNRK